MQYVLINVFIFIFLSGFIANADTSTSTSAKVERTSINSNELAAPKSGDLDAEVSDIKLRANSGAKSKFSASLSFNYSGSSLEKPGDDQRPNVGNERNASPVRATGDIGLRYRINKNKSLFIASGMSQVRPLTQRDQDKLEVDTPHLGYNDTFASDDVQISSGIRAYVITDAQFRNIGEVATLGYTLSTMSNMNQSRFSGGVSLSVWGSVFDKSAMAPNLQKPGKTLGENQNDYGFALTPSFQFNKTGRVNAYTSLNLFNYSHFRSEPQFKFESGTVTQTFGIGVAVVRDFYLSPYISFEPKRISSDKTTVNLSASINL